MVKKSQLVSTKTNKNKFVLGEDRIIKNGTNSNFLSFKCQP